MIFFPFNLYLFKNEKTTTERIWKKERKKRTQNEIYNQTLKEEFLNFKMQRFCVSKIYGFFLSRFLCKYKCHFCGPITNSISLKCFQFISNLCVSLKENIDFNFSPIKIRLWLEFDFDHFWFHCEINLPLTIFFFRDINSIENEWC